MPFPSTMMVPNFVLAVAISAPLAEEVVGNADELGAP
jgi:hypothetical protein